MLSLADQHFRMHGTKLHKNSQAAKKQAFYDSLDASTDQLSNLTADEKELIEIKKSVKRVNASGKLLRVQGLFQ